MVAGAYANEHNLWLVICAIPARADSYGVIQEISVLKLETAPYERVLFWDAFSENIWSIDATNPHIFVNADRGAIHVNALSDEFRPLLIASTLTTP